MKLFCIVLAFFLVASISWNIYPLQGNRPLTKQAAYQTSKKGEAERDRDEAKDEIRKLEEELADIEHFDSDDGTVGQGYQEGSMSFTDR